MVLAIKTVESVAFILGLCCDHSDKVSHNNHVRNMMAGERARFLKNTLGMTFPHIR